MNKISLICALSIGFIMQSQAQTLYMPRNIKEAFHNGTRSVDGRPGVHYWQNRGRYDIHITVIPEARSIKGSEKITYINHSPDTLSTIVFRLVLNFHKPEAIHYGEMDAGLFTPGIQVDSFSINGQSQPWEELHGHYTWQNIRLPQPLLPGDSVRFSIDWHNEIAQRSGREGMIDSSTCYLAYFYPRVSVYDDYNGWDRLDFTGYQEFYNDFNDYNLQVKVPRNYIVWATGTLQNPDEVLQPEYAQRLKKSFAADSVIHIATPADLLQKNITAKNRFNTWKWQAMDVTDMAIGISDHYNWDAGSVIVDEATRRRASVQAAYNDTAMDFHHAVKNGTYSLGWFSRRWPGVPYPYPKMTIVQGYADMEYPMMVNDASTEDLAFSRLVADHEIAHTYFPFYMGINESRYPFMDEGWATTFELLIGRTEQPEEKANDFYKKFRVTRWINDPSQEEDIPITTPANILRGMAYGSNAYGKPSLAYLALKDLLGDALFKKCMHAYMDRWHGRHPIPWDFFNSFTNVSGQDLTWFWNNWFFSNHYDDLSVRTVRKTGKGYALTIQNTGGFAIPFDVTINYTDGSSDKIHQTPSVWRADQKVCTVFIKTNKKLQVLEIDNGLFMDANKDDNTWKPKN